MYIHLYISSISQTHAVLRCVFPHCFFFFFHFFFFFFIRRLCCSRTDTKETFQRCHTFSILLLLYSSSNPPRLPCCVMLFVLLLEEIWLKRLRAYNLLPAFLFFFKRYTYIYIWSCISFLCIKRKILLYIYLTKRYVRDTWRSFIRPFYSRYDAWCVLVAFV